MSYIEDTNIFMKHINTGTEIIKVADHCKSLGKTISITDIILDEFRTPRWFLGEEKAKSQELHNTIVQGIFSLRQIELIEVTKDSDYKKNFEAIRSRYYGHLLDPKYVKAALDAGEITQQQFKNKSYQFKDYGECSCLAVAMDNPKKYTIVSNDKGRVFLKPNLNLFDKFREKYGITIWDYDEWVAHTNYKQAVCAI